MRKLYLYCGALLCYIALCFLFLLVQPTILPLDVIAVQTPSVKQTQPVPAQPQQTEPVTPAEPVTPQEPTPAEPTPQQPVTPAEPITPQEPTPAEPTPQQPTPAEPAPTEPTPAEPEPQPADETPYECPDKLVDAMKLNPDVYAWITIPGTNVDLPVAQRPDSDTYYMKRDLYDMYSICGMLMTQPTYNTKTFNDPVTVIYGHCMLSGAMFGQLQSFYCSENGMEKYKTIEICLPDKGLTYEVFAAVPYDNRHILYNYDFSDPRTFTAFFRSVYSIRSFNANVVNGEKPINGDKVLILSTCLVGDISRRYLIMAKLK